MQGLVRRKGYGTNQLLRDGAHPRRYYDIRIWRNAEAAAQAEADPDIDELRRGSWRSICSPRRWSMSRGPSRWGLRRPGRGRSASIDGSAGVTADRRVQTCVSSDRKSASADRSAATRGVLDPSAHDRHGSRRRRRGAARLGARAARRGVFRLQSRCGARNDRRPDYHRLQHRELDLRAHDVRGARCGLQGDLRRTSILQAHRDCRRHIAADIPVRRVPADPVGIRRQHRSDSRRPSRTSRRHQLKDLLPHPFDARFIE